LAPDERFDLSLKGPAGRTRWAGLDGRRFGSRDALQFLAFFSIFNVLSVHSCLIPANFSMIFFKP
jgi:hypothetical protein